MESMSDGEKRTMIAVRLISVAVIVFVFAGATAIKKPAHRTNENDKNLFEIAFLTDITKTDSGETVARENDNPEVPVTAMPEEKVEEKTEKEVEKTEEAKETPAASTIQQYDKVVPAKASAPATEQPTKITNPNNPNNYDAGSPYAGQVYIDGGEAPELNNPTYYDIPGGNPNVVIEPEPEKPAPVTPEDSDADESDE